MTQALNRDKGAITPANRETHDAHRARTGHELRLVGGCYACCGHRWRQVHVGEDVGRCSSCGADRAPIVDRKTGAIVRIGGLVQGGSGLVECPACGELRPQ